MGSQIILNTNQQHPFRINLNKLRSILNNPAEFQRLTDSGLQRINVVSDHVDAGDFKSLFGSTAFMRWANGSEGWDSNRSFYWFVEIKNDDQYQRCHKALVVLRETLNDKDKYEELVKIGPCALTLRWEEDDPQIFAPNTPILISNFIPDHMPNSDYSIREDGTIHFHD